MRRTVRLLCGFAALVCLLLQSGCAPNPPAWVDAGGSYTVNQLSQAFAKADISRVSSQPVSEAAGLRHGALTRLRRKGPAAATAADLLTKTLSSDTRGVPVYVERATIQDVPGIVMVEATGRIGGKLSTKRLWAISDVGTVIFVGTH